MQQAALSARQAEREHIQGMLNVAFTRPRDEMHIFHTAEIDQFGMATGAGAIREWLEHCKRRSTASSLTPPPVTQAQSEFEAQVIRRLSERGVRVKPQYPSCGYFIDIVAEIEGRRIAIECDGELWHLDEHGKLKVEDILRQEILERAGWKVTRVPYRSWLLNAETQLNRIMNALNNDQTPTPTTEPEPQSLGQTRSFNVDAFESAVIRALKEGARDKDDLFKRAREFLGRSRLGPQIRLSLEDALSSLRTRKIVVCEDNEFFFASDDFRDASYVATLVSAPNRFRNQRHRRSRRYNYPRRF